MNKFLFANSVVLALLATAPAGAADWGPPGVPSIFSWTGFYIGAHAGYGWTSVDVADLKGGFGGAQMGYNYQTGNLVIGIEGDGSFGSISDSVNGVAFGIPASVELKSDALYSLRGRIGWAAPGNLLFYGTAGGGWGEGKFSGTALGVTVSDSHWHSGWTAGGGVEWAFAPNWSAKVEYLHYGLNSQTYFGIADSGNVDIDTVKIGVNFRFH